MANYIFYEYYPIQTCNNRCDNGLQNDYPCQCNDKCADFHDCCPDYDSECGGGGGGKYVKDAVFKRACA